jgi:hypothetical protein
VSANLQQLSRARFREANLLLRNSEYSGAYYLAGYAVECGLKACITRQFRRYEMPDKKLVADSHIHDLNKLAGIAGLDGELRREGDADPAFGVNWGIVCDWNEAARYQMWSRRDAEGIIGAIGDRRHGVAQWIRRHW